MNYIDWFSYFKPVLHSWDKPCLYMIYYPFYILLGLTCHSLFTNYVSTSVFMHETSFWSSAQLRPILCDPMDCSPPGSSVHGLLQTRLLEWVAISFSRGSPQSRGQTHISCVSCIGRWILYYWWHLGSPPGL